jgi:tetratricopeptide (TPR) repeat protein
MHLFRKFFLLPLISFLLSSGRNAFIDDINKYFNRADKALLSHQYNKAIAEYLKGINYAEKREIYRVWDDLGYAFLQKREIEKSIHYLKRSIDFYPENFNVHLYLAAAFLLNNQIHMASEELEKIENDIYFNDSWMKVISDSELRRTGGERDFNK